jgi:HAD superfamily hydrolase (TIGR01549 family)
VIAVFEQKELQKLKKLIDRYNYVSFDLFDTLIKRDCYKPTELFAFVEQKINQEFGFQSQFAQKREQAEVSARGKSNNEEITLEEIYDELSLEISNTKKEKIRHWEEEYEYVLCQWNPYIKPIYEYCLAQKKKIFIVTDIYLSEKLIQHILDKLEIHYDALFVSSAERKTKSRGTLFREVLKKKKIKSSEILHIGDNRRSDYLMPRKLGIQAFHISKDVKINLVVDKKIYKQMRSYANLCSFINNHADTHSWDAVHVNQLFDFFSEAGYEIQGPVLYGYIIWLQEQFKKEGIEKVFFLARDGQLMQRAYQRLPHTLPNNYMYASRKALIIPSLWMNPSISEIKKSIFWGRRGTIRSFLKKIGLNPSMFEQDFTSISLSLDFVYEYERLWKNSDFLRVFEDKVKEKMIMHSRQMYDLLLQYLKQIDFQGKVAVVDIGWYGHMQGALERVVKKAHIPVEIYGYYLGMRPDSSILREIKAKGYLFGKNNHETLSAQEIPFNSIIEMLFSANHGTTKGYKENRGKIEPVLEHWEYDDSNLQADYASIRACQEGALKFIDDMLMEKQYFQFDANSFVTFTNWLQLGNYPSTQAAECFGNLHFLDDNISCLAKPQEHYSYLFHPKMFLIDFRDSFWRMGFLTRVLGDFIPYADGYEMIRKIYFLIRKIK